MKLKSVAKNILVPFVSMAAIILLWWIASIVIDETFILPSPKMAFATLVDMMGDRIFWLSVGRTLFRSLRSFVYAVATAIPLAILARLVSTAERFLDPIISVLRSIPTMAIILITVLWLSESSAPVLIAYLITFPMLYSAFLTAMKNVDYRLIEMAKAYRVPIATRLYKLYIPAVTPDYLMAMKSSISLSLKVTIASEVLAQARVSIGNSMQGAMANFNIVTLFAWTIVAIVFSYLLELVVALVRHLVVRRWKHEA